MIWVTLAVGAHSSVSYSAAAQSPVAYSAAASSAVAYSVVTQSPSAASASASRPSSSFLLEQEREFFRALGGAGKIEGKEWKQAGDHTLLPAIAARAAEPLKSAIEAIAQAIQRRDPTKAEMRRFEELFRNGISVVRGQMQLGVLRAFLGDSPWEITRDGMNAVMEQGEIVEAWKIQRICLQRWLDCGEVIRNKTAEIGQEVERRSSGGTPPELKDLRLVLDGGVLGVAGKNGAKPVEEALIQISVHRASARGQWVEINDWSEVLLRGMGIRILDVPLRGESHQLAQAQERAMSAPMTSWVLLPKIPAGASFVVRTDIGLASLPSAEKVDLKWISPDGAMSLESVQDPATIKRLARELLRIREAIERRNWDSASALLKDFSKQAKEVSASDLEALKRTVEKAREQFVRAMVLAESQFRQEARSQIRSQLATRQELGAARAWATSKLSKLVSEGVTSKLKRDFQFMELCAAGAPGWQTLERGEPWVQAVDAEFLADLRGRHRKLAEHEKLDPEWASFGNGTFSGTAWWEAQTTNDSQRADYLLAVHVESANSGFEVVAKTKNTPCAVCNGVGKARYRDNRGRESVMTCTNCNGDRFVRKLRFR